MAFLLSTQNVFDYLVERGLSSQANQSLSQIDLKPAKNFNLLLTLPNGNQLLVKQERHDRDGKTAGDFLREWQIRILLERFPEFQNIRPYLSEALYFDPEHSIIVFNYLQNYRDLADFYTKENIFPTPIAQAIGAMLGSIHRVTLDHEDYRTLLQSREGSTDGTADFTSALERLTPERFSTLPADSLHFFALYQRYDSLRQAIAELKASIDPCCLIHNDLKLNNILLSHQWQDALSGEWCLDNGIIRLIDWERSAWGDPASDLGTLIASYLQAWLYSLITSKSISLEESLRLATTPLERIQPSIAELTIAYCNHCPQILERYPNFLYRVVQFAGLALIHSILATLQHQKSFGNSGICILQVAKSLLSRPQQSVQTVFGAAASELIYS